MSVELDQSVQGAHDMAVAFARTSRGNGGEILSALKVNDYDPIAPVFDRVMGNDFHDATHQIRLRALAPVLTAPSIRCLDLCCGTGIFFERLNRSVGVQGYGIDLSRGQIEIARSRPLLSGLADYRVGDAAVVGYPVDLDLVTINFDAINHLYDSDAWKAVFCRSHESLRTGGAFLFDYNLPERLSLDWDSAEIIVKDDIAYIQGFEPLQTIGRGVKRRTPMTIFRQVGDNRYQRLNALIEQFSISVADTVQLLRACGFNDVRVIASFGSQAMGHLFNKNRAYILAVK